MDTKALLRLGLFAIALAVLTLGLNLMNIRNDIALLAGAALTLVGFGLGAVQIWNFYRGIEK